MSVIEQTGYGSSLPEPDRSALDEQEAQDRAQEAEYRDLRLKAVVSLAAARVRHAGLDAAHGRRRGERP